MRVYRGPTWNSHLPSVSQSEILSPLPHRLLVLPRSDGEESTSVLLSAWAPLGGDICSGCVWHMCPQPWPKVAWDSEKPGHGVGLGRGSQGVTEAAQMGLPAPFSPLPRSEPGVPIVSLRSCTGLAQNFVSHTVNGKSRAGAFWHTDIYSRSLSDCLLCAGQPADTGEVVACQAIQGSPSAPTIMVEGQGGDHHHAARWGRCASGESGEQDGFSRGFVQMKPEE